MQSVFTPPRLVAIFFLILGPFTRIASAELIMIEKAADSVFATGAEFSALAGPTSSTFAKDFFTPTVLPDGMALTATYPSPSMPTSTATNTVALEPDFAGSVAFFDSEFSSFLRPVTLGHRASAEGHIEFKVDTAAVFAVDGMFSVDDAGSDFGQVELSVDLLDITGGAAHPTTIFSSYQKSISTTDQVFMIGGLDGDDTNVVVGTPDGLLDPSKHYALRYLVTSVATSTTTAPATASGRLTFSVSAVPEPSSVAALLCSAAVLTLRRRRS